MAKCPNCNATITWNASSCHACLAELGDDGAWHPIADSPEEKQLLDQKYPPPVPRMKGVRS